jgi:hypothetical protein
MSTRHDMLVELASDQINQIEQMFRDDEYQDVHHWLHPIFVRELMIQFGDFSDADLQTHYCDQLGVDIPNSSPLSSDDEQTEVEKENAQTSWETPNNGSLPEPSGVDSSTVPSIYSVSDAKGLAEVAAAIQSLAYREKTVSGFEPKTEVRIPMRLLLRLVHGEGSIG